MGSIQAELENIGVRSQAADKTIQRLYHSHWKISSTAEALEDLSGRNNQPFKISDPGFTGYREALSIKFVGREEYSIFEGLIEKEFPDSSEEDGPSKGVFLNGQPGIGKSCFSRVLLIKSLAKGRLTLLLLGDKTWQVCCNAGVFQIDGFGMGAKFQDALELIMQQSEAPKKRPRLFIDLGDQRPGEAEIPAYIYGSWTYVLVTSSPRGFSIVKRARKQMEFRTLIMNPWEEKDLERVCDANGKPWDDAREIVELYGPFVRNVMQYKGPGWADQKKSELQAELVEALKSPQFGEGPQYFTCSEQTSDVPHRIFCLRRRRSDEYAEGEPNWGVQDNQGIYDIGSDHIKREVLKQIESQAIPTELWSNPGLGFSKRLTIL